MLISCLKAKSVRQEIEASLHHLNVDVMSYCPHTLN